jgi:hypothetical protein
MKNLLAKLKPEYLELLNENQKKFPFLVDSIKSELIEKYFYVDLKVSNAYQLTLMCNVNFGISELHFLFLKDE